MGTGVHVWSQTAASNGTADSAVNLAEGMAPSALNDSGRALMAKVAEYRDDNAGTLTTAGTSTAYTVSANATYATLSELNGQRLAIRFNATNGASPTLNVDSLGAKAIQTASGTAVPSGALLANSIHDVTYDNSIPAFILHGALAAFPSSYSFSGAVTIVSGGLTVTAGGMTISAGGAAITGNVSVAGTLSSTSDFSVGASNNFTVGAASGNTAVAGTLAVTGSATFGSPVTITGTATLSSGLNVAGDVAVNTNKFTVASSSGNTVVAGTLGVTGAATLSSTLAVTGASTLTGALSANNSAGITGRNTVKAFGRYASGALVSGSFNIASVSDGGTTHTVSFTNAMANTNYIVMLTCQGGTPIIVYFTTVNTGSFVVAGYNTALAASVDPGDYSFVVLSNE